MARVFLDPASRAVPRRWQAALAATVLTGVMYHGGALAVPAPAPSGATSSPARRPAPDSSIFFPHPAALDTSPAGLAKRAQEKMSLGRALEKGHSPAAAIMAYQNATQLDPTIPEANYRMGMLFLSVNQYKAAAECFVQELKYHPENQAAARQLGIAYARIGQSQSAILQLEPIVRKHPSDAEAWAALGFAYMGAKRTHDAENALRRAISLKPGVATWHRDLGVVLATRGDPAGARSEYHRAGELDPHDATPWINLGNLERRQNRPEAALEAYRVAEKRDTLSPLSLEGQVEVLKGMGHNAEAGDAYRRWLERKPDDHRARYDAVRLYDDMGRDDISLEIARQGVRFDPGSPDAQLIFGMALQTSGDWRGGLAAMRRAEAQFRSPEDRARARAMISVMRSQAPDSLREFFAADSLSHPGLVDSPVERKPVR